MDRQTGRQGDDRSHIHAPSLRVSHTGWLLCLFLPSALRYPMSRGTHSEQSMGLSVKSRSLVFSPERWH